MGYNNNDIWTSVEELEGSESIKQSAENEFFNLPVLNELSKEDASDNEGLKANRRDFLKLMGFSAGAVSLAAACKTPVRRAIPYVVKPDSIVPGVATYYASNYVHGGDFCPILVKTREGRPIKIEGNVLSSYGNGGTTARVQASVLDLYDVNRFKAPFTRNENGVVNKLSLAKLDGEVLKGWAPGGQVRIVSNTINSPAELAAIERFKAKYPSTKHVMYDPISCSALLQANETMFGDRVIPDYKFDKASVIVSVGADFLGTWVAPVRFSAKFAEGRKLTEGMSRLYCVETGMSLTGSNADHRVIIKPSERGLAIATLYNKVAAKKGGASVSGLGSFANPKASALIDQAANDLLHTKHSIVVSGSNNLAEQMLINKINMMLGNYGQTIDFSHAHLTRKGDDKAMQALVAEVAAGNVNTIIFLDEANPVYDLPNGEAFGAALAKVPNRISTAFRENETSALCNTVIPSSHFLERWGDVAPMRGYYSIIQPTISTIFDTRSSAETLLALSGDVVMKAEQPLYAFIKQQAKDSVMSGQSNYNTFGSFWDNSLKQGFSSMTVSDSTSFSYSDVSVGSLGRSITSPVADGLEMELYEPVGVGNGQHANNPWLQEMPDPITRVCWDSVLHVPVTWDGKRFVVFNNLKDDGTLVDLSAGDETNRLAIVRQFGQAADTVSLALGYGRSVCGAAGKDVGSNAYKYCWIDSDGYTQYYKTGVNVSGAVGKDKTFANVQHHHTLGVTGKDGADGEIINVDEKAAMTVVADGFQGGLTKRSIIRHANLDHLDEAVDHLIHEREHHQYLNDQQLYGGHDKLYEAGHHWGLHVDLSSCTGCGACQVACIAENNVPIVGKKEVHRHHEMTWMRIDRYYYGDVDNPSVVYQPMMCQHCDNAPCENVCPVAATPHSSEGLNQMVYNRCVGTRYCANNCPYKVRRFNWLDYNTADLFAINENDPFDQSTPFYADNLTRMVLNPDVTVRSRGVMEKCSMCVQRIQEGKLKAKHEGRKLLDGEIQTACQTACPTHAITFGDMNDPKSKIVHKKAEKTSYIVLEETNVRSAVTYQMRVTNKNNQGDHV